VGLICSYESLGLSPKWYEVSPEWMDESAFLIPACVGAQARGQGPSFGKLQTYWPVTNYTESQMCR
jgi:hypothetical protein